jgi:hypothetical protein
MSTVCERNAEFPNAKVAGADHSGRAGIVGSNPTQGMDVCIMCIYSVFVLFCVQVEAL